jgi:hypothetical protein
MPDNAARRAKAREAILSGRLPRTRPDRRFGGFGIGATCAVCGDLIGREEMQTEIEFNRHGVPPGIDRYHLHPRCYIAWDAERLDGAGLA